MSRTALAASEPPEPMTYSVPEAAHVLGIGTNMMWRLIHNGDVRVKRLGRRTLVLRSEVERVLADPGDVPTP